MAPIVDVLVRPGDRVRRGAPLVRLDAREIDATGARASVALDAARQSAGAAESDTRAAEAGLRIARLTHDRIQALHDKRSATPQELDQAADGSKTLAILFAVEGGEHASVVAKRRYRGADASAQRFGG